jgi:hypothetical protein
MLQAIRSEWASTTMLGHKLLEQRRGFFVHLQWVYPAIAPFLKGIHLTLDSWRPGRDDDGWRIPDWEANLELPTTSSASAPEFVRPVTRFGDDLNCLEELFAPAVPPQRVVRSSDIATCIYGFVDASGTGFGSSLLVPGGQVLFRQGIWGRDADHSSSNYRELCNLVETLEDGCASGNQLNSEVFIFTDNSTTEGAFYSGNSSSHPLFDLVRRLRQLDMHGQLILHVIHVSGSRMIMQGTDGLSRGDFSSGVLSGQHMLEFIPLHLAAPIRSDLVLPWVHSWAPDPNLQPLTPAEWYTKGHGLEGGSVNSEGVWIPNEGSSQWFLWAPPPAAAATARQELGISRHKRTRLGHIFLCPRLFTQRWRKKLFNLSDIVFEVKAGCRPFWPELMHEPLLVGHVLPLSLSPPWQLRGSQSILALAGQLRQVWQSPDTDEWPLLRQLCACA